MSALRLLDAIIQDPPWRPPELEQCLTDISQVEPELKTDHRYRRLLALVAKSE